MNVLIYEHLCATTPQGPLLGSLETEGHAMLRALLNSVAAVPDVQVATLLYPGRSAELPREVSIQTFDGPPIEWLRRHANSYDAVLPVAPEKDGLLAKIANVVPADKSLIPSGELQDVFADKYATSTKIGNWAIPTSLLNSNGSFLPFDNESLLRFDVAEAPMPDWTRYVVKPRDGAGSIDTAICSRTAIVPWLQRMRESGNQGDVIVQPYWPGLACSVGMVSDGRGNAAIMPPVEQRLDFQAVESDIEVIRYIGGRAPLPDNLARRVQSLADLILDIVSEISGYVGIDVVLGAAANGMHDRIVEINPRPTTSVVLYAHCFGAAFGSLLLQRFDGLPDLCVSRTAQSGLGQRKYLRFNELASTTFSAAGVISIV